MATVVVAVVAHAICTDRGAPHESRRHSFCAESGCAFARGLWLGDVRLCQFGLFHGGHHGRFCRLFCGRCGRRGRLGHIGLDIWPEPVLFCRDVDHARLGCMGRPGGGQKTHADVGHGRLRTQHGGFGVGGAGSGGAGFVHLGAVQYLLFLWRVAHGFVFARTGQTRGHGPSERLGLVFGLHRRHADAGHLPGLCFGRASAGRDGWAVCAGDHVDHGSRLWRCGFGDFCLAARALAAATECPGGVCDAKPARLAPDLARGAAVPRLHPFARLCGGLPRRGGGGHHLGCHLCRAGHWLSATRNHGADLCAEPGRFCRGLVARVCARPLWPQADLGLDLGGLGGDVFHRSAVNRQGHVLVGCGHCRFLHGIEPVVGPCHGRPDGAAEAIG